MTIAPKIRVPFIVSPSWLVASAVLLVVFLSGTVKAQEATGGRWWSNSSACSLSNGNHPTANGWTSWQSCEAAVLPGIDSTCAGLFGSGGVIPQNGPNYVGPTGPGNLEYSRWYSCAANTNQAYNVRYFLGVGEDPCENGGTFDPQTLTCPNTNCDAVNAGRREQLPWQPGSNIPSQGLCDTATNCNAVPVGEPFCHADTVSGTQTCTLTVEHTDQSCTLPQSADLSTNPDDSAQCANIGGDLFCQSPDDPNADSGANCGYVNGEYICLGAIPTGTCVFLGDGGMACEASATSPPAPDTGTPGVVASPDNVLSNNGNGTDVNLFGGGTVSGSSGTPTGTGGAGGGSGGSGTAPDPNDDNAGGSASSSPSCDAPPVCTGGDAQLCAILQQSWENACQDLPPDLLTQAGLDGFEVSDLEEDGGDLSTQLDDSGFLGTRTCELNQTVDLGFFGVHTFEFNMWCNLFAFVGYLVLAAAWIGAARIVSGAF